MRMEKHNMFASHEPVLPSGAVVVVTGVSGFIGSHIADQLLAAGYSVRGTTRDAAKSAWLAALFEGRYGADKFELHEVPDMAKEGAFEGIVHGASGVVNAASDTSFAPDPNAVITPTVAGAANLIRAAARSPSVRRFVQTSSCAAATSPGPGPDYPTVTAETWNDATVAQAWAPPPYEPSRGFAVYAACKTEAERALWTWYREEKPAFVLNAVLPSMNMGKSLDLEHQGHASTSGLVQALFMGNHEVLASAAQYFYIDVQDTARLHVAALLHPEVREERVFAYAGPYTWRTIQQVMQTLYPQRSFAPDVAAAALDGSVVPGMARAEALLREMGRDGWTSLEDCVRMNTEDLV
ncbi:aldehyde reductase [Purpureocillium lavendulum]|uniref:Aldehyde reductase n=1 Tax=Purpureocillium lavendulum TaxID=1247861 RepID=A0AB34G1A1_9HYPO|nr:aldehyde reductase [Purpureocillium lavendulum]